MDSARAVPASASSAVDLSTQAFLAASEEYIRRARLNIAPFVHCTPVVTSRVADELTGAKLFFKCENFQVAGAFKARGAHNAVLSLPKSLVKRGVITHSSGNHGAAVSLAARNRGLKAQVVIPHDASATKVQSIRRYGGTISWCEPTLAARETMTQNLIAATGAAFVHPYDDYDIIAGQATAVSELLEQVPDLEVLLAPVGGGGLLSGMAVAGRAARSDMKIYGVEPEQVDDAARSLRTGTLHPPTNRPTIADGLRVALGVRNFAIIRTHVDDIVTVTEDEIVEALRLIWEILKIVVEPSSAAPLAAILRRKVNAEGRRVGVVLTGGNVDLGNLPWLRVNGAAARRVSADRGAATKRRR